MRYLGEAIEKDLKQKMVILSGPRQCGKTTLAKELLSEGGVYLNWDIRRDQKLIREMSWDKSAPLLVLDEIHKSPKWKNYLKGLVDEFGNKPKVLVTGSARLDTFRKSGDALTGRFYSYTLHPIDVSEGMQFLPNLTSRQTVERLLDSGGFPEAFLQPQEAERLRNNRMDLVLQEDLRDISRSTQMRGMQFLLEIFRERTGELIQFANLAKDLSVSPPTVKSWIEILEKLYLIFLVHPFSRGIARSLRKEFKVYFYDSGAAYDKAQRLENIVACSLLKQIQFRRDSEGKRYALHFFRDREKREVDFVLTKDGKPRLAIEVKTSKDSLSPSLAYFTQKTGCTGVQWILENDRDKEISGIKLQNLSASLAELPTRL